MRECVRSMCGVSVVALQFQCLLHSLFGVSWGLSVAGGSLFGMGFVSSSGLRLSGGGVSLFFSSFVECWICICLVMFLCSHAFAYAVIMSMRLCMVIWDWVAVPAGFLMQMWCCILWGELLLLLPYCHISSVHFRFAKFHGMYFWHPKFVPKL